jgi:hypothetical protein
VKRGQLAQARADHALESGAELGYHAQQSQELVACQGEQHARNDWDTHKAKPVTVVRLPTVMSSP